MNTFYVICSLFLILLSMLGFYSSSEKQIKKTFTRQLKLIANNPRILKTISVILYIFAFPFLAYVYDYSIAFISLWVFSTPILLIIILFKNDLKQKKPKQPN
jgi:L-asparagine transporter-like permease